MAEPRNRAIFKTVEIEGQAYRIKKMTAMMGSYYAVMLMSMLLPAGIAIGLRQAGAEVPETASKPMSRETFQQLQLDCLRLCEVDLPIGPTPVIHENGSWALPELEYDMMTTSALTVQALLWTFADFFDAGRFASWIGLLAGSLPSGLTSMLFSMVPSSPGSGNSTSSGTAPTP